jgi:8-oxo-dGTP pyrophosphatase MutT (NUDIX family)
VRRFFKLIAAAHLVLVNDDGQVLLGRRQNTGSPTARSTCRPGTWNLARRSLTP